MEKVDVKELELVVDEVDAVELLVDEVHVPELLVDMRDIKVLLVLVEDLRVEIEEEPALVLVLLVGDERIAEGVTGGDVDFGDCSAHRRVCWQAPANHPSTHRGTVFFCHVCLGRH